MITFLRVLVYVTLGYKVSKVGYLYLALTPLRVAKQLEWTGHELSECIDDLEKLDEDRRIAVMGIYAKKCRMKNWHDTHVKIGRFKQGDLVLLYTLKKLKRKLKMRGLGPFIINELTSRGTARYVWKP